MNRVDSSSVAGHRPDIRNRILDLMLSHESYVSGEDIRLAFGITRTAVWKHIQALESLGFAFDKRHGVGYVLKESPDLLLEPLLRRALPPKLTLGKTVYWSESMTSTNTEANRLAQEGAPHGTIVTAVRQVGGKGRLGRPWASPQGGLWQSLIWREPVPIHRAAEVTLLTCVAVRRVLVRHTGLPILIKWPNDLLCNGRKLCGILAEIKAEGEYIQHAIIGVGLNSNIPADQLPQVPGNTATSTLAESGRRISHIAFEVDFLVELESLLKDLSHGGKGFARVADEWRAASATLGRRIQVSTGGRLLEGEAVHLDDDGVLVLRTDAGVTRILSGDVLF